MADPGDPEAGDELRELAREELERELLQDDIAAARQRWRAARDAGDAAAAKEARAELDALLDRRAET